MWSNIVGHKTQIAQLQLAISSNRLAGAYVFSGPAHLGKRMIAEIFTATLVCHTPKGLNPEPCGQCESCKRTRVTSSPNKIQPTIVREKEGGGDYTKSAQTIHPDVFVVEPEALGLDMEAAIASLDNGAGPNAKTAGAGPNAKTAGAGPKKRSKKPSEMVKIEQIRELQSKIQFHPMEGSKKVVIIDEADRMTKETANCLLKTLEEPPPDTHIILVTPRLQMMLPTIRSRCRHIAFQPLSDDVLVDFVKEKMFVDGNVARRISKLSQGCPGIALSVAPEFVEEVITHINLLTSKGNAADIIETAEGWSKHNVQEIGLILDIIAGLYRDSLRLTVNAKDTSIIHPESKVLVTRHNTSFFEKAIEHIAGCHRVLDTTANKQLMFENLLFTLAGKGF